MTWIFHHKINLKILFILSIQVATFWDFIQDVPLGSRFNHLILSKVKMFLQSSTRKYKFNRYNQKSCWLNFMRCQSVRYFWWRSRNDFFCYYESVDRFQKNEIMSNDMLFKIVLLCCWIYIVLAQMLKFQKFQSWIKDIWDKWKNIFTLNSSFIYLTIVYCNLKFELISVIVIHATSTFEWILSSSIAAVCTFIITLRC